MTGEQKILYIEKQIEACRKQRTDAITCPYCDTMNVKGNPLCCNKFAGAVAAILMRKDLRAKAEHVERIAESVSRN